MLLSCLVGPRPNHAQWLAKGRRVRKFYRHKFPIVVTYLFIEGKKERTLHKYSKVSGNTASGNHVTWGLGVPISIVYEFM